VFFGFFLKSFILTRKKNFLEVDLERKILEAEKEAEEILKKAREKIEKKESELEAKEKSLLAKDDFILDERKKLEGKRDELEKLKKQLEEERKNLSADLERLAGIGQDEALDLLKKQLELEHKEDLSFSLKKLETTKEEVLDKRAKEIISMAIQRYSKNLENNLVTSSVKIPSEEVKGKIIGKDGRNIKAFEKETGVQLLIDQCPDEIIVSSFDPIRREVAVRTLEKLIFDGVINPAKVEEFVTESRNEVVQVMANAGKEAAEQVGVYDIPKEVLDILGGLYFRSSFGQNVLKHSVEMAHIAEVMAEELGADVYVTKAAALLHDIGKAVDFETKGTHVEIGRKILKKYGVNEEIIKAMQSHHREYPNENLESYIVDAADAISGSRPGARSDNADMYIKKLEGLERITKEFKGVENAYAISAGREVRVFVKPDEVDDYNAKKMAREIALKIEEELKYPGEIKIALIREQRIVEFAR
jgi:ribonuclease Y